jgi:hypothetical protein
MPIESVTESKSESEKKIVDLNHIPNKNNSDLKHCKNDHINALLSSG